MSPLVLQTGASSLQCLCTPRQTSATIRKTARFTQGRMLAPFRKALGRVLEILAEIKESIPNDQDLDMIYNGIVYMIRTGTGSGVEKYRRSVPGGEISRLNRRQCDFAMRLFNTRVPSDTQIVELRPTLAPVLQAAFQAAYKLVEHLKDTGVRLILPEPLRGNWSRRVYLRDCAVDI